MIIHILIVILIQRICFVISASCVHKSIEPLKKIRLGFIMLRTHANSYTYYLRDNIEKIVTDIIDIVPIPYSSDFDKLACNCENMADVVLNVFYPEELMTLFTKENLQSFVNYPLPDNRDIFSHWNDKKRFKAWMITHGFGDYVPKSIDIKNPIFPIVVKGTISNGSRHVFIATNQHELDEIRKQLENEKHEVHDMLFEEALTGMGNVEGDVLGVAFNGELLSMVCQMKIVSSGQISRSHLNKDYFILSGGIFPDYEIASCGSDIQRVVSKMMKLTEFSGAFGISFKMDSQKRIKFFDMNPRIDGNLYVHGELLISAFVPLAYKMHSVFLQDKRFNSKTESHPLFSSSFDNRGWFYNQTIIDIVVREKKIADTGIDPLHDDLQTVIDRITKSHN